MQCGPSSRRKHAQADCGADRRGPGVHVVQCHRTIDRGGAATGDRGHRDPPDGVVARAAQPPRGQAARAQGSGAHRGHRRRGHPGGDQRQHGRQGRRDAATAGRDVAQRPRQRNRTSTSSSRTRAPTGCSCCSSSSATSATPTTRTRTPTRTRPGPPVRRPAPQRDPRARPQPWTTRRSGSPTSAGNYFQDLYFGTGNGVESMKTYYEKQSSGRYSIDGERHRLGEGPLQRGPLRPLQRLPVRRHRLRQHVGARQGRHEPVGRRPEARRRTAEEIEAELATYDV